MPTSQPAHFFDTRRVRAGFRCPDFYRCLPHFLFHWVSSLLAVTYSKSTIVDLLAQNVTDLMLFSSSSTVSSILESG